MKELIYGITKGTSAFLPYAGRKAPKEAHEGGGEYACRGYEYPRAAHILPLLSILPLLRAVSIIYTYCLAALR